MNEAPQDAWFYTIEGERLGPVGFADLRVKASEGGLNPRLDMIWTHGMEAWKPAGEIDGLFEKRSAPDAPESLAPEAGPYTPPKLESVAETMGREGDWPGVRRRVYLIMTLIFPILWQFGFGFGAGFLGSQLGPEIMGVLMIVAMLLPLVVNISWKPGAHPQLVGGLSMFRLPGGICLPQKTRWRWHRSRHHLLADDRAGASHGGGAGRRVVRNDRPTRD
jgi:hypothetical protein